MVIIMDRKSPTLTSYLKVKDFFKKNKYTSYPITGIRDILQVDFYSVGIILKQLVLDKDITNKKGRYQWKSLN
jgi:hypothetical protein